MAVLCVLVGAGCGGHGADVTPLRRADKPYFWVGKSFDGLELTHVEQYGDAGSGGVADLIYGDCRAGGDMGCPPPLELQHRLCRGALTIVIFVGSDPKPGRAARAAKALRPLNGLAKRVTPRIAFDRSKPC